MFLVNVQWLSIKLSTSNVPWNRFKSEVHFQIFTILLHKKRSSNAKNENLSNAREVAAVN